MEMVLLIFHWLKIDAANSDLSRLTMTSIPQTLIEALQTGNSNRPTSSIALIYNIHYALNTC